MRTDRATLPAWQRRLLASGSVALDIVHSGGVGAWTNVDIAVNETAVAWWLGLVLEREVAPGHGLAAFRELRESLFHCARRHVGGRRFRPHDVEVLNRFARGPALAIALDLEGKAVLPVVELDEALAHIAREGIMLFTGTLRDRVRECAAADCQLLFVDKSRPGHRQWCSMARCGNIAKTRAYRGRSAE